jgi:predicted phage tail protein
MMQQSAQPIKGAKSGGSGSQTPYTAPDTLRSVATAKLLYAISEGEIEGLVNGYNSVYLDGTPVKNSDDSSNIEGVTVDFRAGTVDQSYIQGFPETNNEISVGVELRYGTPWVRQFTNPQLSAVRLRFAWPSLLTQKDNGDRVGYRITYAIDVSTDGGSYTTVLTTAVDGKTESEYERSHRIDLPQQGSSWQIRVRRLTENADSVTTGDTMNVVSYTEVVDAKLRYPHTALLAVQYNSEQFSSVPKFAALCRGRIIQVPTNYDPELRTYATSGAGTTNGVWDGTFKLAYTNNPAWVWYDLILHKRYGLGNRINANMVNKWKLYQIAQYCDVMVDDGKGGTEPRYTCNVYIQTQSQAYKLLNEITSIFHGSSYWDGSQMVVNADMPEDPIYNYTNANVINGIFEYKGTALRDRHSVATAKWSNPDLNYEDDTAVVFDDSAVTLGISQLDVDVVGCTSEGQAQRAGLWALKSEQLETRTVTFAVGLDGQIPRPFNIINIADQMLQGAMNGGRIKTANASVIQLDRISDASVGDRLIVNLPSGKAESRNITDIDGYHVTVSPDYSEVPQAQSVWVVDSDNLAVMQFRVLSIKRSEEQQYEINGVISVPGKHAAIDSGAKIDVKPISVIPAKIQDPPTNVTIGQRTLVEQTLSVTVMTIQWDAADGAVAYDVEWRKDNSDWIKVPRTGTRSVEVRGVYIGQYLARVTAINAADISSKYATSALTDITGKTGAPPALASLTTSSIVFGIDLNWSFPAGAEDTLYTEIYYATNGNGDNETLLGQYAYPLDNHTLNGLAAGVSFWFKARIVDRTGNIGPWTDYVQGSSSSDAGAILDYLTGKITESELAQDLLQPIQSIPTLTANIDSINQQLAEITGAGAWVNTTVYDSGDYVTYDDGTGVSLYRAKQDAIPAGTLPTNTTYWEYVGDYASIGEAVAALTASVTDIENSIDVLDGQLTANVRRTDTMISAYRDDDNGEGRLADVLAGWKAKAAIKLEQKTRASEIEAEAQQRLNLTATVNSNYSDITQQLTVLSNDQQSTAQSLEQVVSTVGDNTAAVQQVSQAQADLEGNVSAMWKVSMNVTADGKYYAAGFGVGFDNGDQGLQSAFYVLANKFAILNQVTGTSAVTLPFAVQNGQVLINNAVIGTLQNKTIIQRVGTSMQVFGIGFGSSGQFIEWFGPDVGDPSNCTEANATSYKKTNGDQFTGGSFRSGVLQNGYQNTGISAYTVGDYPVSFGPFGTNGRSKTVLLSISAVAPTVQFGTHLDGWSPGTLPTPVFGWAIERKIGSGSWTQIAAGTITGSTVVHQDEIPDTNQYNYYSTSSIDGSYTYTDNSVSMDNFNYRVRVTAWTSVYSGSNPTARQSIGLTSIES